MSEPAKIMLKDGEYDDKLIEAPADLQDSVRLIKSVMRRDDRVDREVKMEAAKEAAAAKKASASGGGTKKKLEKAVILEQYFKLEDKDEVIRAVSDNLNKNKDIEIFKNKLLAICVLLPNLAYLLPDDKDKDIKGDEDGDEEKGVENIKDKKIGLPVPVALQKDGDQFDATMAYYKPEGYLSGREDQIDKFIRQKILQEPGQQMHLLREVYTILATHYSLKEIKAEKKRGEELKQALLAKEAAVANPNSTAVESSSIPITTSIENVVSAEPSTSSVPEISTAISTSTALAQLVSKKIVPTIEELRAKLKAKLKTKGR